ncbi:hypothetical protein MC885_007030 [Smutsia gigantea]|nr:hypothetical protein MC885_007030 [Smutsia gigantea]
MIIYWDLIGHDDMFSNINKIQEIVVTLCLEVEGKMVSRTEGNICDLLTSRNASTEGPEGKSTKSTEITGDEIVMNHHLQETSFTEDYMKSIKGKIEEPETRKSKTFYVRSCQTNQAHPC